MYPRYLRLQLQHVQIIFGSAIPASLRERLAVVRRDQDSKCCTAFETRYTKILIETGERLVGSFMNLTAMQRETYE